MVESVDTINFKLADQVIRLIVDCCLTEQLKHIVGFRSQNMLFYFIFTFFRFRLLCSFSLFVCLYEIPLKIIKVFQIPNATYQDMLLICSLICNLGYMPSRVLCITIMLFLFASQICPDIVLNIININRLLINIKKIK